MAVSYRTAPNRNSWYFFECSEMLVSKPFFYILETTTGIRLLVTRFLRFLYCFCLITIFINSECGISTKVAFSLNDFARQVTYYKRFHSNLQIFSFCVIFWSKNILVLTAIKWIGTLFKRFFSISQKSFPRYPNSRKIACRDDPFPESYFPEGVKFKASFVM